MLIEHEMQLLFSGVTLRVAGGQQLQGYSLQLVPHQAGVKGKRLFRLTQSYF